MKKSQKTSGRRIIPLSLAVSQGRYSRTLISEHRKEATLEAIPRLVSFAVTHPHAVVRGRQKFSRSIQTRRGDLILGQPFPREFADMTDEYSLGSVDTAREFVWAAAYLNHHRDRISHFVSLADRFNHHYLSDELTEAEEILANIDSDLGKSLWLIKNTLPLLQRAHGLDSQKRYSSEVRESSPSLTLPVFITHYLSERNEPSVSPSRFQTKFHQILVSADVSGDIYEYLRYHVIPTTKITQDAITGILRLETIEAVIDYYECFIFGLQCLLAKGLNSTVEEIKPWLEQLSEGVKDPRLKTLIAMSGWSTVVSMSSPNSLQAAESLFSGDNAKAGDLGTEAVQENATDINVAAFVARAIVSGSIPSGISEQSWARRLGQLLNRDSSHGEDLIAIEREALNFFGAPWANLVLAIIEEETSDRPSPAQDSVAHFAAVGMPHIHPFGALILPAGQHRDIYAAILADRAEEHLGSDLTNMLAGRSSLVSEVYERSEEAKLFKGRLQFESTHFDLALITGDALLQSKTGYYRKKGVRLVCGAMLRLGKNKECNKLLTTIAVTERTWQDHLPIMEAAQALAKQPPEPYSDDLSTPIIFELYTRHVNTQYDSELMFSFLEFLSAHGMNRPSELINLREQFDEAKLIYFLRYVCVESVMDRSGIFSKSQELLEERLAVCRVLIEIDPANEEVYQSETKFLLRKLVVQRGLKEVEQSKIYVDTDSIKRTVDDELYEAFNRYTQLRRGHFFERNREILKALLSASTSGSLVVIPNLELPTNEIIEVFKSIVRKLHHEYLFSSEHGLDKYLSVRVRHGTLAAHLRRPVENSSLVTTRDLGSQDYKRNTYWESKLQNQNLPSDVVQRIILRLGRFSKDYDNFIDEIKSLIHIKKDHDDTGVFDFNFDITPLYDSLHQIREENNFNDFIDRTLEFFAMHLDANLSVLRERIANDIKSKARSLLEALLIDVQQELAKQAPSEIVNAIHAANTDLQYALDRVITWFHRTRGETNEPFSLQEAIEISATTVRAVAPQFSLRIENEEDLSIDGKFLASFVDIFFIIFENIVRHSGSNVRPAATVLLTPSEDYITIRVENETEHTGPTSKSRIAEIKTQIQDEGRIALVRREGGTGFYKLTKLLAHDLSIKPDLDFDIAGSKFFVSLKLPRNW